MTRQKHFELYGPREAIAVSPDGSVSLVERPSLIKALKSVYPGCTISDNREPPVLSAVTRLAARHYNHPTLDNDTDLSLG
ncbi:hypothetical protein N9L66_00415 [Porticoccaceae bacterium]|nr:hypothetical protein [Porticoccaceae bacterium]MDB2343064.1 hypothetical protein [Porticoccaceae bacterium]